MNKLDPSAARELVAGLPAWRMSAERGGVIHRDFVFADFAEAFAFMTRVGLTAQEQGHHPDMTISWNVVTITITTHDAGNKVTDKDRRLAAAIEAMGAA